VTLIRTSFQPSVLYDVAAAEYEYLARQALLFDDWHNLYVNWLAHPGGPLDEVTAVTITIAGPTPLATTSAGVTRVGFGSWWFPWSSYATPSAGAYTVTWAALNSSAAAVTAAGSQTV
jgi:hypothetical protein